jgi:hypothetical protein
MREKLPQQFPGTSFAFLPADIVSQVLNFGVPAPFDLQVAGRDLVALGLGFQLGVRRADRAHRFRLLSRRKPGSHFLAGLHFHAPLGASLGDLLSQSRNYLASVRIRRERPVAV